MVDVKVGDFVLVRDSISQVWRKRIFYCQRLYSQFPYLCVGIKGDIRAFRYMIPFAGNEDLEDRGSEMLNPCYDYRIVDNDNRYVPRFCPRFDGYWGC